MSCANLSLEAEILADIPVALTEQTNEILQLSAAMKRILVIEDDDSLRLTIKAMLRKHGYEVLEAANGGDGIELARAESPDLVLSDVNMAGVDGFGVLRSLRSQADTSAIPVILMTGVPESQSARLGMERGADDYLAKPFELQVLVAAIRARLDRQQAIEAHAKGNEKTLLEILSTTPDLVAIADANSGRLRYLNTSGRRMLAISASDELPEMRLEDFHADAETAVSQQEKVAWAKRYGNWVGESAFVSREGRRVPVSKQILAHRSAEGEVVYLSVVARDITERLVSEQALRESENRYRDLIELQGDGVVLADAGQRFTFANPAAEELLGVPAGGLIGRYLQEFLAEKDRATVLEQAKVRKEGERTSYEIEVITQGGQQRQLLMSATPRVNSEGRHCGTMEVMRDITGRKRAEQERQMMEVQLRQAQKLEAIGQLASGIAHEINTPTQYVGDNTRFLQDSFTNIRKVLETHQELLCAVKGNVLTPELIARAEQAAAAGDLEYLFEQIPAAINETLEGVGRITKIVRAMKEFSHPGGKEKSLANLNTAIESTVTVARNEWKYVADMNLELDPDLPAVPCFLGEFNQVVLNLVINAAHAIGEVVKDHPGSKGVITVRSRRDGDHVEVRVSDTGGGIPEGIRSRIFEPFFTTKAVGKGTGQGLSIVYSNVVKKHGGAVRFESEVGKGTTFILRFPLAPRTAETPVGDITATAVSPVVPT